MIKCPLCDASYTQIEDLYQHIETHHGEVIPQGWSSQRFYYYSKTGRKNGSCVVCKKNTDWNDKTNKYHRFCNDPKCKEKYRKTFEERMVGKHGKVSLLDDPEHQRKMLMNRSISGTYEWSDGGKVPYTGSYELDFLRMADNLLDFNSQDIMAPSPHTYWYEHEGVKRFYIPDFYIPSLNLEIEIKDGGDNPNNHHKIQAVDKVKEKLKDGVMKSQPNVNYIKLMNKEYGNLFKFLNIAKENFISNNKKPIIITENCMILNEDIDEDEIVTENALMSKIIEYPKNMGIYPVYVLLTYTDSTMAKMIKSVKHQPYSHSSISFDSSLTNLFTYGRKTANDVCKFTDESIKSGLLGDVAPNVRYSLYVTFFGPNNIKLLIDKVNNIKNDITKHGYSYRGLLNAAFNRPTLNSDKMFCSQFVADVIASGDKKRLKKHSSLYSPSDLINIKEMHFVTKGILSNYDKNKVDNIVDKLRKEEVDKLIGPFLESTINDYDTDTQPEVKLIEEEKIVKLVIHSGEKNMITDTSVNLFTPNDITIIYLANSEFINGINTLTSTSRAFVNIGGKVSRAPQVDNTLYEPSNGVNLICDIKGMTQDEISYLYDNITNAKFDRFGRFTNVSLNDKDIRAYFTDVLNTINLNKDLDIYYNIERG